MKTQTILSLAAALALIPTLSEAAPVRTAALSAAAAPAPAARAALTGFSLRLIGGSLDTTVAAGAMLHVVRGMNAVELQIVNPTGDTVALAEFRSPVGSIRAVSATSAMWYLPADMQAEAGVLRVKATGLNGTSLSLTFPVRLHEHSHAITYAGSQYNLAAADNAGHVNVKASGAQAAYQQDTAGLFARVGRGPGRQGVSVALLPLPATQKLTVTAAVKISQMEIGTEFALAVSSENVTVAVVTVRNDTGRLVKRLTLVDGTSLEQNIDVRSYIGNQIMLKLSVDAATGLVSAYDTWTMKYLQADLSVDGTMLTPVLSVSRNEGGAVGVTFVGVWTNQQVAVTNVDADGAVCKASAGLACRNLGDNKLLIVQMAAKTLHKLNVRGQEVIAESTGWAAGERVDHVVLESLYPVAGSNTMLQ